MSKNLKGKSQKKQNSTKFSKEKLIELQNTRIIQKNLVHVIGISEKLCDNEVFLKSLFFSYLVKKNILDNMEKSAKYVLILNLLMIQITKMVRVFLLLLLILRIMKQLLLFFSSIIFLFMAML